MSSNKLPSFKYNGLVFHNVYGNLFQTKEFRDKLIYKWENGEYHLIRDEK